MNYSLQRTNGSGYCKRKLADDGESLAGQAVAVSSGVGKAAKSQAGRGFCPRAFSSR